MDVDDTYTFWIPALEKLRQEQQPAFEERPFLELPLPIPYYEPLPEVVDPEEKSSDRGVIIIDMFSTEE